MIANEKQVGGQHYRTLAIQPWDYIEANRIPYLEGCAIKYITRWRDKGGVEDLKKAIHFIEKRIEIEESRLEEESDGSAGDAEDASVREVVGGVVGVPEETKATKVRDQQGSFESGPIRP